MKLTRNLKYIFLKKIKNQHFVSAPLSNELKKGSAKTFIPFADSLFPFKILPTSRKPCHLTVIDINAYNNC